MAMTHIPAFQGGQSFRGHWLSDAMVVDLSQTSEYSTFVERHSPDAWFQMTNRQSSKIIDGNDEIGLRVPGVPCGGTLFKFRFMYALYDGDGGFAIMFKNTTRGGKAEGKKISIATSFEKHPDIRATLTQEIKMRVEIINRATNVTQKEPH